MDFRDLSGVSEIRAADGVTAYLPELAAYGVFGMTLYVV